MPPSDLVPPPALSAWSSTWRVVVALVVGAAVWGIIALEVYGAPEVISPDRAFLILALDGVVGLLAIGVLFLRRRFPIGLVLALTALTCVSSSAVAAWSVAVVSLATRRRWREVVPLGVLSLLVPPVYALINPVSGDGAPWWVTYAIGLLVYGILVMIGFYVGARRELLAGLQLRAETAEREQSLRVAQAREQERTRIAREMHDVLAHRISLVAMHAGALAYRDDLTRDETREAATIIQDGAHRALTDLREVLGVLRDPMGDGDADGSPPRPQPTLRDVPGLVAEAVEGGMRITFDDELPPGTDVPMATGRTVYRMVQEALTNARKHAPGIPVLVRLTGSPGDRLDLEVRNHLPVRVPVAADVVPGAGMGLTGLAERAALADGGLEHGPTRGREFVLRAWLPWVA